MFPQSRIFGTRGSERQLRAVREIPELNGLRAVAILLVMFYHFRETSPEPFGHFSFVYWTFAYGWIGVDLFFVLSGFLITTILLNTRESPKYFQTFYCRRALRIFPIYCVAVLLFFHVELPWIGAQQHAAIDATASEEIWYWTYLVNWRNAMGHDIGPMIHLWSLSIEEQFYLLWPLAVWFCPRKRLPALCLGLILISFLLRLGYGFYETDQRFVYYATVTRVDGLALGSVLAVLAKDEKWRSPLQKNLRLLVPAVVGGLVVLELAARTQTFIGFYAAEYLLIALACGALVFHCVNLSGSSAILCSTMRWPVLQSIGKYSYAMYLFHLVVNRHQNATFRLLVLTLRVPIPLAVLVTMAVSAMTTYLLAFATWHVIEKHFLNLKSHFSYRSPSPEEGEAAPQTVLTPGFESQA